MYISEVGFQWINGSSVPFDFFKWILFHCERVRSKIAMQFSYFPEITFTYNLLDPKEYTSNCFIEFKNDSEIEYVLKKYVLQILISKVMTISQEWDWNTTLALNVGEIKPNSGRKGFLQSFEKREFPQNKDLYFGNKSALICACP